MMRVQPTVNRDWCNGGKHEVSAGVYMTETPNGWTCPVCLTRFLKACGVEGGEVMNKWNVGDRVYFNGPFPGVVIRRYAEGMIEVRGDRGVVCIPDEDCTPRGKETN